MKKRKSNNDGGHNRSHKENLRAFDDGEVTRWDIMIHHIAQSGTEKRYKRYERDIGY